MIKDPAEALEKYFGFREFLDGQTPVISALLAGQDAMVVMPTGGGKSLCYQLPAMVMDGVTLVVSPLIALMKDQVDSLNRKLEGKGVRSAMINSTLSLDEQREVLAQLRAGDLKLLYVAPERFRSEAFQSALSQVEIALFAVDEAHCLSQWGHDFRPDYLRLEQALERLGHPQTAAFTATATPQVREDILKTLKLRDPFVSVTGFERPNLSLRVHQVESAKEKYDKLNAVLKEWKTGIVYCATRKRVEEVAERLKERGIKVTAYHGGMSDTDREKAQNAFINRVTDVAVATNAFGMGIDRADVRFVVHFEVPGSIEAYYQEAGRAGRDREPAVCELLFNFADTSTQEFFIEGNNPGPELIRTTYGTLLSHADNRHEVRISISDLAERAGAKNDMAMSSAISVLARSGYVQRFDIPGMRVRGTRLVHPNLQPFDLELDEASLIQKEQSDRAKLQAMVSFSYGDDCRQQWILRYFGEAESVHCGSCDICQKGTRTQRRAPDVDEKLIVQKALSGVARMSRRTARGWVGRFGKGKIVNMLVGSKAADILDKGLDQLSTYGMLKDEGASYIYALFKEMEGEGMLHTAGNDFPLMTLSERGAQIMRDEVSYQLNWPKRSTKAATGKKKSGKASEVPEVFAELGFDEALYEKLAAMRAALAMAEGNKPHYTIFSNQTLKFFTRLRPKTVEAGLRIRGVGPAKAEKILEDFIAVIRRHEAGGQ